MYIKINIPRQIQFKWMSSVYNMMFGQKNDIFYIGGAEVLPPPLEAEEEAACISCLGENGEATAKSRLIEHNLRLVVYIAKKFDNTGIGVEDLISIGTIGLIKSINTFNPQKKMEVSIDEPLNVDWDGNELLLSDILGTDEDVIYRDIEAEVEHHLLGKAIDKLSGRERMIVELRYGLGKGGGRELTQKEVADRLGISQSYISRLEKKIMRRLKKEMIRLE